MRKTTGIYGVNTDGYWMRYCQYGMGIIIGVVAIVIIGQLMRLVCNANAGKHSETAEEDKEIDYREYDLVAHWVGEFKNLTYEPYLKDGKIVESEYKAIKSEYNALKTAKSIAEIREAAVANEVIEKGWKDEEVSYYQYDTIRNWVEEFQKKGNPEFKTLVDKYIADGSITRNEYDEISAKYTRLGASFKIAEIRKAGGKDESPENNKLGEVPNSWNDDVPSDSSDDSGISAEIRGDQ